MTAEQAKCVYAGLDGWDIAFKGKLPQSALSKLEAAKDEAQRLKEAQLIFLGPGEVAGHVGESGKRGGFRYTFATDEAIFWFKRSNDRLEWNIFISFRAVTLATYGPEEALDRLYSAFDGMGASIVEESINRVDIAIDFTLPGFELESGAFVKHYHCKTMRTHDGDDFYVEHLLGQKLSSVTIGKQPGRQVIVYNKRREVIERGKDHWWQIWGLDKADKSNVVWRVETRFGKQALREDNTDKRPGWDLRKFKGFFEYIGDLYNHAMEQVRFTVPTEDSNTSRHPNHPLWDFVKDRAGELLADKTAGDLPGRIVEAKREQIREQYEALIFGLTAGRTVTTDDDDTYEAALDGVVQAIKDKLATPGGKRQFLRAQRKAERRYYFLEIDYRNNQEQP